MAAQTGFVWIKPPSLLGRALTQEYAAKLRVALRALGADTAQRMQDAGRRNAPWHDRTGNARSGLFGDSELTAALLEIILAHSVAYGVYLELAHGARYAIIMKTIYQQLPALKAELDSLFR